MERPVPDLDVLVINAGRSSLEVSRRPLGRAVTQRCQWHRRRPRPLGRDQHGFTPLEGLVMGTRPGQTDPEVLLHMLRGGMDVVELERVLNHASDLRGWSGGRSTDVRDLRAAEASGDEAAALALGVFAYRVRTAVAVAVVATDEDGVIADATRALGAAPAAPS